MKKHHVSNNTLTIFSILSVFALFFGVCLLALVGLFHFGVIDLPVEEQEELSTGNDSMSLPVHMGGDDRVLFVPSDVEAIGKLLPQLPFADSYYVKIELISDKESDPVLPESGIYEIWRYGERFKINHYTLDYGVVRSITCDGTQIQLADYRAATAEYFALSSEYCFDTFSPIPNFQDMTNHAFHATSYREEDGVYTIIYEYDDGDIQEKIAVSMETGILQSFIRRYRGEIQMQITLKGEDFEFAFQDYMFNLN